MIIVQIILQEPLGFIYDYQNFEIKLNPLLEKLQRIKEEFGEDVASLIVGILEIQEEDRYNFQDILNIVSGLLAPPPSRPSGPQMLNSNRSQRALEISKGRSNAGEYCRISKQSERGLMRIDLQCAVKTSIRSRTSNRCRE